MIQHPKQTRKNTLMLAPASVTGDSRPIRLIYPESRPIAVQKRSPFTALDKSFTRAMDHFFTLLILISGEEDYDTISIGHIL